MNEIFNKDFVTIVRKKGDNYMQKEISTTRCTPTPTPATKRSAKASWAASVPFSVIIAMEEKNILIVFAKSIFTQLTYGNKARVSGCQFQVGYGCYQKAFKDIPKSASFSAKAASWLSAHSFPMTYIRTTLQICLTLCLWDAALLW